MFAYRRGASVLLAAVTIGVACGAIAAESEEGAEGDWSASAGAEHETGNYGRAQTTSIWTFPVSVLYGTDDILIDASVPYLQMTGPAGATAGQARHRPGTTRPIVTTSGIGDSTLSLTGYLVQGGKSGLSWDLGGVVKFATGNVHEGLGTGANDYSVLTSLSERIDRFSLTGTLGRWWLGSAGIQRVNGVLENLKFTNPFYATLDASYKTEEKCKVGVSVYGEQVAEKGGFPQGEVTIYTSFDTSESTDLRVYLLKGFKEGSPDRGAGATFSVWF